MNFIVLSQNGRMAPACPSPPLPPSRRSTPLRTVSLVTLIAVWAGCTTAPGAKPPPPADDPLLQPVAPTFALRWLGEQKPFRVHGNTFLVGFSGLNVALIDTGEGLILVDTGVPQGVPAVQAHIRALGFKLQDVKYILSTEPHYDHGGGLAAMARDTGAVVAAGPAAALELEAGRNTPEDPQNGDLPAFPPVPSVRRMADGETLALGNVVVTAYATPGHTAGSTSWGWRSCADSDCAAVVFASSLSPISAEGYSFSTPQHQPVVDSYRRAYARLREAPCDLLIAGHPEHFDGEAKRAGLTAGNTPNPFVQPGACRAFADAQEARLERRLEEERTHPQQ
jgi:metallo-beta-lactamase class B